MTTVDDIIAPGQKVIDTFHEVANIFPMMYGDEFRELAEDIRVNGLMQPILTYQGKIIDGRNRFFACIQNGQEPRFEEWDGKGSLLDCVLSLNLKRRHLTSSQKAMVALELEKHLANEARKNMSQGGQGLQKVANLVHAAEQAATIVGTNHTYVTDAKKLIIEAPELKEHVLNGSLTIPQAKAIVHREWVEPRGVPPALQSSDSNEWYTPEEYVHAARELMGGIDLDPASCAFANETVKAARYYDITENGLDKSWKGRIWLNPPYGVDGGVSNQELWSRTLIARYEVNCTVTEAVLLVNANTEAKWFQPLYKYLICLTNHRIRFYNGASEASQPTQGNALVYFGKSPRRFIELFSRFGTVVRRANADEY